MTNHGLIERAKSHGLLMDGYRQGAGNFRDIYFGTGAEYSKLDAFRQEMKAAGLLCHLEFGNVEGHDAYRKQYAVVESFYWV